MASGHDEAQADEEAMLGAHNFNGPSEKHSRCDKSGETDRSNGPLRSGNLESAASANHAPGWTDRMKHTQCEGRPAWPDCEPRFHPARRVGDRLQPDRDKSRRLDPDTARLLPGLR